MRLFLVLFLEERFWSDNDIDILVELDYSKHIGHFVKMKLI